DASLRAAIDAARAAQHAVRAALEAASASQPLAAGAMSNSRPSSAPSDGRQAASVTDSTAVQQDVGPASLVGPAAAAPAAVPSARGLARPSEQILNSTESAAADSAASAEPAWLSWQAPAPLGCAPPQHEAPSCDEPASLPGADSQSAAAPQHARW